MHELLLPVLDQVRECATSSAADPEAETVSGLRAGKDVMLIHHSRNTQSKQWDSTWEMALQGVIRIYQTGFKLWSGLASAQQAWADLLAHFEDAFLKGSPKVASSAVLSMKALIVAHAAVLSTEMWRAFSVCVQRTVEIASGGMAAIPGSTEGSLGVRIEAKTLKEMLKMYGEVLQLAEVRGDGGTSWGLVKDVGGLVGMYDTMLCAAGGKGGGRWDGAWRCRQSCCKRCVLHLRVLRFLGQRLYFVFVRCDVRISSRLRGWSARFRPCMERHISTFGKER